MDEIGLLPGHDEEWKPPAVVSLDELRAAGKRVPKIVIYMSMAQYHPAVVAILGLWGIKALSMSGAYAPSRRAMIQQEWQEDENIPVLVISDAGSQGLNLVAADGMILEDTPWSETEVTQIIARLWRHGQKRPTFVVRLVAKRSVEYMMVANGISKRDLLDAFMDGKHSPHLIRALTGTGTDEDTAALLAEMHVKEKDVADLQQKVEVKKRGGKKKAVKSAPIVVDDDMEDLTNEVIDVDKLPDDPPPKKTPAKKPRAKKAAKPKDVSDIQPPRRQPRYPSALDSDSEEDESLKLSRPPSVKPVDDKMAIDDGNEASALTTKEQPDAPSGNPEGQTSSLLLPPHGNPTGSGVRPAPPAPSSPPPAPPSPARPRSPPAPPSPPPARPQSPADPPSPHGMQDIEDEPIEASQWKALKLAEERGTNRDADGSDDEEAERGKEDEPMAPAQPTDEPTRREDPESELPGPQPDQQDMDVDEPTQPIDTPHPAGPVAGLLGFGDSPLSSFEEPESRPPVKRALSSPESVKGKAKRTKAPRRAKPRRHESPEEEESDDAQGEQDGEPDVNIEDPESPAHNKRMLSTFRRAPKGKPKASTSKAAGSKAGGSGANAGSSKRRAGN
ncbi:hypothetical protein CYLTODRAFT_495513 [Cylindrobasidium torrendii FP15055 ss-10]|uniref:Helicase C-terminal domain-containing protein n=1 Tax=Cylindrobasidium torrendii FP15055 ss-10 TaxID=1314674 RepID=A0A0D7ARF9_9AGAR|nr:hypothetical protein CYLTODRAFT_495513 [Cylindrobasidium torrendii FP15055 ss-10]